MDLHQKWQAVVIGQITGKLLVVKCIQTNAATSHNELEDKVGKVSQSFELVRAPQLRLQIEDFFYSDCAPNHIITGFKSKTSDQVLNNEESSARNEQKESPGELLRSVEN